MLERLHLQNYGCVDDATFSLSPLHALIGPNDSGKSTVLRALRTLTMIAAYPGTLKSTPEGKALLPTLFAKDDVRLEVTAEQRTWGVQILRRIDAFEKTFAGWRDDGSAGNSRVLPIGGGSNLVTADADPGLALALAGSQLLRLDPDALRLASNLIPDGRALRFLDERGDGLPGVLDAVLARDIGAFQNINDKLIELFPTVKSLSLTNSSESQKSLGIRLHDGTHVSSTFMSEGLLYYLAYAALPYLEQTALLLIEEPENGLHPARIGEVMRVLREISKSTQVIIATHSPLVVNELEGHEVSVLTRSGSGGTKATLLKDTPNFEERSKVYALGELWVSYANGTDEAPLLKGGPRP